MTDHAAKNWGEELFRETGLVLTEYLSVRLAREDEIARAYELTRRFVRERDAEDKVRSWLDARGVEYRRAPDGSLWIAERLHLYYAGDGWEWTLAAADEGYQLPAEGWEDVLVELLRTEL